MDSLPLSPPSKPSKQFPVEIHGEILKFCDVPTLASTSLVSISFLDLSSSILYRDVSIVGHKRFSKFFCSRTSSEPRIERFLSLDQVRSFTSIVDAPFPPLPHPSLHQNGPLLLISHDRLPLGRPLAVEELHLQLQISYREHKEDEMDFPFHLFNPSVLTVKAPSLLPGDRNPVAYPSTYLRWPRLTSLLFQDSYLDDGPLELLPARLCSTQAQVENLVLAIEFRGPFQSHSRLRNFIRGGGDGGRYRGVCGLALGEIKGAAMVKAVIIRGSRQYLELVESSLYVGLGSEDVEKAKEKVRMEVLEDAS